MRFTSIKVTPPTSGITTTVPVLDTQMTVKEMKPVGIFAGFQYRNHNVIKIEASPKGKDVVVTFQRPNGLWLAVEIGVGKDITDTAPELAWLCSKDNAVILGPRGEKATRQQVEKALAA